MHFAKRSLVSLIFSGMTLAYVYRVKNIKWVVKALNDNSSSVLCNKIKLLGTGEDIVSVAFTVKYY